MWEGGGPVTNVNINNPSIVSTKAARRQRHQNVSGEVPVQVQSELRGFICGWMTASAGGGGAGCSFLHCRSRTGLVALVLFLNYFLFTVALCQESAAPCDLLSSNNLPFQRNKLFVGGEAFSVC